MTRLVGGFKPCSAMEKALVDPDSTKDLIRQVTDFEKMPGVVEGVEMSIALRLGCVDEAGSAVLGFAQALWEPLYTAYDKLWYTNPKLLHIAVTALEGSNVNLMCILPSSATGQRNKAISAFATYEPKNLTKENTLTRKAKTKRTANPFFEASSNRGSEFSLLRGDSILGRALRDGRAGTLG